MKKTLSAVIMLAVILICASFASPASIKSSAVRPEKPDGSSSSLETRFLNMLNHNYVYGTDFNYADVIVNNSIIALLDSKDSNGYVKESYVKSYVYNMYGIEIEDLSEFNSEFPSKDGYVYVVPRGYSTYKHSDASVSKNEDGTYTVTTDVTVTSHDGTRVLKATSMFVKNDDSSFGFNILRSDIVDTSSQI